MHRKGQLLIVLLLISAAALLLVDTGIHFRSKLTKIRDIVGRDVPGVSMKKNAVPRAAAIEASAGGERDAVVPIDGRRYKQMVKFFRDYRDTCKQANVVLLGDMIHETLQDRISVLVLPFDPGEYCNEFATTRWCHLMNFDLFVFPAVVKYETYDPRLTDTRYGALRKHAFFSMEGSDDVVMHVDVPDRHADDGVFYLYGYGNEIFIIPRPYAVQ